MFVYVVVQTSKKSKHNPEEWELRDIENPTWPKGLKTIMAFKSRRTAKRWINYWNDKNAYEPIAVKLDVNPLGKLVR
jgi:hypothetical protein